MDKQEKRQSLLEHLYALRNMLIISVGFILVAFVLIFIFGVDWLMELIAQPIKARGIEVSSIALTEPLLTKIKVALIASVVAGCPVVIWQIWRFVSPALYQHEKRTFWLIFLATVLLFLVGVIFCYVAVYILTVEFFIAMGGDLVEFRLSIAEYVDYMFGFVVPFGLAFELPVVLYLTTRMGLTNYQMLASKRKYVILAVAIIAAVLTPPDVVSQIMLLIPILLLFEIGLQVSRMVKPRDAAQAEDDAEATVKA